MRTGSNMTDFLVKTFVKDYENTGDIGVRTEYGLMASTVGICCNVLLFAAKLFIGLLINSISVMADAFNNLSDAASSIIGFIGVKMAGKPRIIPSDTAGWSISRRLSWHLSSSRWVFRCLRRLSARFFIRKR